jgi:hypothetical protein
VIKNQQVLLGGLGAGWIKDVGILSEQDRAIYQIYRLNYKHFEKYKEINDIQW